MPSSVVQSFAYDPSEERLDIRFATGRRYSNEWVPTATYAAMTHAFAKGEFFNGTSAADFPSNVKRRKGESRRCGLASRRRRGKLSGMVDRYVIRRDPAGFTVADNSTGEPLVLAMHPQTGLTEEDAEHLAALFNKRSQQGERAVSG